MEADVSLIDGLGLFMVLVMVVIKVGAAGGGGSVMVVVMVLIGIAMISKMCAVIGWAAISFNSEPMFQVIRATFLT